MSNITVVFTFEDKTISLECKETEIIKDIFNRFALEVKEDITKLCFTHNNSLINTELRLVNLMKKDQKNINIIAEKINYDNYIIAQINIYKYEREVRIINSFEEMKRKKYLENKEDDYKYENEKEIKEKCIIEINNKIVPFNYFYQFKEKNGSITSYIIKYIFKE